MCKTVLLINIFSRANIFSSYKGVGKTSLLVRFHENNFSNNQKTTIGVDYKAKEITIDGEAVKLQIWDTAGQERFRSMTAAFYNRAQGVIVAFDVSNAESFQSLSTWINDVRRDAPPGCLIILCANKADLPLDSWKVSRQEFMTFASDNSLKLFEASASNGLNVNEMFYELGKQVVAKFRVDLNLQTRENQSKQNVLLVSEGNNKAPGNSKASSCC